VIIAKRNIKDIPKILKSLETARKELKSYQYFLHIEILIENIDEALEELGYTYLQSKQIVEENGKV
jgi:hypothetical protein